MSPETHEPAPLWSTKQLADYLGIRVQTLHALRNRGEGPRAYRIGRFLRYDPAEVTAWLRSTTDQDVTAVTHALTRREHDDD
jgi:predicted DNA-binding transcriptional regulator AlpA